MVTALTESRPLSEPDLIIYPTGDGKPMADNTLQWDWIVFIKNGLDAVFEDRDDVFIASDLLWYPVEGQPKICAAPDAMVAIGRPKGTRGAYLQWLEDNIPFQVVFEVLSPANTRQEMDRKREFYQRYGVLEYYVYNPGSLKKHRRVTALSGWCRESTDTAFEAIETMNGWRSPRLGITFRHDPMSELELIRPDGKPFESYREVSHRADENARLASASARRVKEMDELNQRLLAQLRAAGIEPAGNS